MVKEADLIPQFGTIKNAGDQGGDFIFFRKQNRKLTRQTVSATQAPPAFVQALNGGIELIFLSAP